MIKTLQRSILAVLAVSVCACSGCTLFGSETDESAAEQSDSSSEERYIITTRTAKRAVDDNNDDEDIAGYTTTARDTETGTLENPIPDEPDPDILATTTTTLYKLPETKAATSKKAAATGKKTSAKKTTAETKLVKDTLHRPLDSERFKAKQKYKVTSDTTYLNLRFGPSKSYDVQLRIPDGEYVNGTARTQDCLGNYWIYTSYKGTVGWVMEELLTKQ